VAGRLSESQKDSILVVEAGIEATSPLLNIPIVTPLLQCTELDWHYHSEPQMKACFGLENNVRSCCYLVRRKYSCIAQLCLLK
jgi:hypothetical protein